MGADTVLSGHGGRLASTGRQQLAADVGNGLGFKITRAHHLILHHFIIIHLLRQMAWLTPRLGAYFVRFVIV